MTQIIRSGAFLQQCWSVHPLCVEVKRMGADRMLVLSCSSCKSGHYLTVGTVIPKDPAASEPSMGGHLSQEGAGDQLLSACIATHRAAMTLREMDVFQDALWVRCAECRAQYDLVVSQFETHQK